MKHDGSLNINGEVTSLMKIFLNRRSFRKYGDEIVPFEKIEYINKCLKAFITKTHFEYSDISIISDTQLIKNIKKAATKGFVGKINSWLNKSKAPFMILCGAIYDEADENIKIETSLKQSSMVMQTAVLAAAECGLATCWLGGISHKSIEEVYEMPKNSKIVAISMLGYPAKKSLLSWDNITYHAISKKRKPINDIWFKEEWKEK